MGTLLRVAGEQTGYSEWIQLRACLADKLKNAITSQHWTLQTGYLPVPVYFRRCPLAGSNLCFSCVLLCLACTTCTALFTQPGSASHCPLPSLVAGTKEWKADATGVHTAAGQLLVDATRSHHRPQRLRACNWQSGSSVAGSSSAPPGLPLLNQMFTTGNSIADH